MTNFDGPTGVLPARPLFSRESVTAALATPKQPSDPLKEKGLPAPERTRPSPRRMADFSICSILAVDGSEGERGNCKEPAGGPVERSQAPQGCVWINCAHFEPSYVPKMKQADSPCLTSRSPRVPFSATQLRILENSFQQTRYLSTGQVRDLALLLGLGENRVKIWFQNRRARERRDFLKRHPSGSVGTKGSRPKGQSHFGWY